MKSVLISIQPKYCELISNGKKTIEVIKTIPKIETPFKCYIYMSQGDLKDLGSYSEWIYKNRMKVIGEFVCDWIMKITPHCDIKDFVNQYIHGYPASLGENDCLSFQEMKSYLGNKNGYDWHISDIKIYDKPKELSEFRPICKFEGKDAICALFCPNWKYDGGLFFECTRKVTRPPQSYMYVEGLE